MKFLRAALDRYLSRRADARRESLRIKEADHARAALESARKIVGQGGLGAALAPTLVHEIEHWPSLFRRDDFYEHINFPATDVEFSRQRKKKHEVLRVAFTNKKRRYELTVVDNPVSVMPDGDTYHSGNVELAIDGTVVLDIHVSKSEGGIFASRGDWEYVDVVAFQSGAWMKDLPKIAATIQANKRARQLRYDNERIIAQAKNIRL